MKSILYLASIPVILLTSSLTNAQTTPSSTPNNNTPSLGNFSDSQILQNEPIQQPGIFSNPNSSSRQFFQQGKDNLYFLEESEPILQIDEEIKEEAGSAKIQDSTKTQEQAE